MTDNQRYLIDRATEQGQVRAIVTLNRDQADDVSTIQDMFVAEMAGAAFTELRRMNVTPQVVVELDAAAIKKALSLKIVKSVLPDDLNRPM